MSLTRVWGITKTTQDVTQAVFVDSTVYGTPNVDRNQEAHYILIAKMDENQILTFIDNIDNSDPLNKLEYQFINSIDGAYRLIQFNPTFYNNGTTYTKEVQTDGVITTYANIIWHGTSGKFYKAIGTSFSGIQPSVTVGWEAYWQPDPDFKTQVASDKLNIFIKDDIITFRYEDCEVERLDCIVDDILCGLCVDINKLFPILQQQLILDGANSENWQNKATRSEIIIKAGTKKFCC